MEFSCICCGTCCRKYQPWLTLAEINMISTKIGLTPEQFKAEYTDHRWPGTQSFLLVHVNNACVFLQVDQASGLSLCSIHSFKPDCCRAWAAGLIKHECQNGLKELFGIEVNSAAQMQATETQLQRLAERQQSVRNLA